MPGQARQALFVFVLAATSVPPGAAIELTVQFSADSVDIDPGDGICDSDPSPSVTKCTLRAAVMEANALPGHDTIQLFVGTYTLSIPPDATNADDTGNLNITDDLTIEGGFGRVIDAGGVDNVFAILAVTATIRNLVVRNGSASVGGCIASRVTELVLEGVRLYDCEANPDLGGRGGGLWVLNGKATLRDVWIDGCSAGSGGGVTSEGGELLIERSTISANTATSLGGGIVVTPGILSRETVLVNSTVRGNLAGDSGGGMYVGSPMSLYNSAVVHNACSTDFDDMGEGGGIFTVFGRAAILANSVVARNSCGPLVFFRTPSDCVGALELEGYNFVGLTDGCTTSGSVGGDILGTGTPLDPGLGPYDDYGGFTPTHHPTVGSPLVDAGNPAGCEADRDGAGPGAASALVEDQRREPRPASGRCDIGPVEAQWLFADGFESGDTSAWSAP